MLTVRFILALNVRLEIEARDMSFGTEITKLKSIRYTKESADKFTCF